VTRATTVVIIDLQQLSQNQAKQEVSGVDITTELGLGRRARATSTSPARGQLAGTLRVQTTNVDPERLRRARSAS
jgi:hypothetical protein